MKLGGCTAHLVCYNYLTETKKHNFNNNINGENMKYLSDYMNDSQTELFKKTGSFFAFSDKQFNEQKVEGVDYNSLGAGMICPKDNVDELMKGLECIHDKAIEEDINDNGIDAIIRRELNNHECDYTGDYEPVLEVLDPYGISEQQIIEVFNTH